MFASQSTSEDLYFLLRLLSLCYWELGERKCEDKGSLLEQTGSQAPNSSYPEGKSEKETPVQKGFSFRCLILMPVVICLPILLFYFFQINTV